MTKLKSLSLEDFLTQEETQRFHEEWKEITKPSPSIKTYSKRVPITVAYNAHSDLPIISNPWQFKDKSIFRARVFQKQLIKFNPYFNSDKYLMPVWHLQHYWMIAEQLWHSIKTISLLNYNRYVVKDLPGDFKMKKPIPWQRGQGNGHISAIGLSKLRRGSWKSGNAIEQFTCTFYNDKEGIEYGSANALCFIGFRSYVKAYQSFQTQEPRSLENLQNLILDQNKQHKRLIHPRTDILDDDKLAGELKQKCQDRTITLEDLDFYFSLYDVPKINYPINNYRKK